VLALLLGHVPPPGSTAELWAAWNTNPMIWAALAAGALAYARLRRFTPAWRRAAFVGALLAIAVALVSPLDAMSGALASAHMVQHLLLMVVAAPLLAASAPGVPLLRGLPRSLRRAVTSWRRTRWARAGSRLLQNSAALALLHAVVVWVWHASAPYEAALDNSVIHGVEHLTFFVTALLVWIAITKTATMAAPGSGGGVLVLFALSVQSAILGALLTFAPTPWYGTYGRTATAWGVEPLADQQLAGVIMWVPGGGVFLVAALVLLFLWIGAPEGRRPPVPALRPLLVARGSQSRAR